MKINRATILVIVVMMSVLTACGTKNSNREQLKDVYIDSLHCGYLSQEQKPESGKVILISTEDELGYAKKNLGIGYPDDYNENKAWSYGTDIVKAFEKMETEYPIGSYSYLIQYEEVESYGYNFHANGVEMDKESGDFFFHYDKRKYPKEGKEYPMAMDGFFYMAAIPK